MSETIINLTIDGNPVSVPAGATILTAAKKLGIEIPTLCHMDNLEPFTSCFLCVVDVDGRPNPAPSCSVAAAEGMVVHTRTERIKQTRKLCLELLLSDHCGDCVAPCTLSCPAGTPIQQFLNAIGTDQMEDAIRLIKQALPIPGALGRVCPRPCENQCRRTILEEPLAIGWLHRHAADEDAKHAALHVPQTGPDTGRRVAIVGAGPAGMSAAYFLRQMGHGVTVFEATTEPGGMLRWGIPAYRLPREMLTRELEAIVGMGVEMQYGKVLGRDISLAELRKKFDAVFLATGAPISSAIRIKGEYLPNVSGGVEFLGRVARGESVPIGRRVIVIGGGNTAIDAVRTARRLGADPVTLVYRRTRAEMPALPTEVEEAEREGTRFQFLAAPVEIRKNDNGLILVCQQMKLGEPGPDGRRKPVPIEGETFELEADTILAAIGQRIDADLLRSQGMELDKHGNTMLVDPATFQTSVPGVFAGGDAVGREEQKIAVWAVGSGHVAAIAMDQLFRGLVVAGKPTTFQVSMGEKPQDVTPSRFQGFVKAGRAHMPELEPDERVAHFREVELGLSAADAKDEARRCLGCGCGAAGDCRIRGYAFEYGVKPKRFAGLMREYKTDLTNPELVLEPGKCISCGICVRYARELLKLDVFGFVERGFDTRIQAYLDAAPEDQRREISLRIAEACPTGAILSRDSLGQNFCSCLAPGL